MKNINFSIAFLHVVVYMRPNVERRMLSVRSFYFDMRAIKPLRLMRVHFQGADFSPMN